MPVHEGDARGFHPMAADKVQRIGPPNDKPRLAVQETLAPVRIAQHPTRPLKVVTVPSRAPTLARSVDGGCDPIPKLFPTAMMNAPVFFVSRPTSVHTAIMRKSPAPP